MTSPRKLSLFLLILALVVILTGCADTPNYLKSDGPRYAGTNSNPPDPASFDGQPRIVTWNIKYARDIDGAIETLQSTPELHQADVILLQEMDADGVKAIAETMGWNYIYYPASVHPNTDRDFGEAVLSPWPLSDDAKLFLPHESLRNKQIRIAVRALVHLPGGAIWAYSIHTETALLPPPQRKEQIETMLADMPDDNRPVVIGGDFNTVTPIERNVLLAMMAEKEFTWLTEDAGATVSEAGVGIIMDYIFGRGLIPKQSGVIESEASDHNPVWVKTSLAP